MSNDVRDLQQFLSRVRAGAASGSARAAAAVIPLDDLRVTRAETPTAQW